MHVYHDGKIFSGSESFLVLWDTIPRWRYLSLLLKLPLFRQLWKIAYERISFTTLFEKQERRLSRTILEENHKNGSGGLRLVINILF